MSEVYRIYNFDIGYSVSLSPLISEGRKEVEVPLRSET